MKAKLKIIAVTFVVTTVFWCLVIIGFLWLPSEDSGVSFIEDAARRGFVNMMSARNTESKSVTFTVAELPPNATNADSPQTVLLERQLPPSGEFWIGIKKTKTEGKR